MNVDLVTCDHCGEVSSRARRAQRYCSERCRKSAFKLRNMVQRSVPELPPGITLPEKRSPGPAGSTPGAFQGDDYPLTYDEDGNVELPECLRRAPADDEVILVTVPPEANEAA
jgi:hypothetical protein